jgi:hypothetical protein
MPAFNRFSQAPRASRFLHSPDLRNFADYDDEREFAHRAAYATFLRRSEPIPPTRAAPQRVGAPNLSDLTVTGNWDINATRRGLRGQLSL